MADWYIVKGTIGYEQQFDIEEPEDTAKNLTGDKVYIVVWLEGSSTYKFKTECTLVDAANGRVKYTTNSTDNALLEAGLNYLWSLLVDDAGAGTDLRPTVPQTLEVLEGPPSS